MVTPVISNRSAGTHTVNCICNGVINHTCTLAVCVIVDCPVCTYSKIAGSFNCGNVRTDAQTELARRLNITKSVVSYYELQERTPSPDVLIQLSKIFHITTDYLLGIERDKMIDVSDLSEEDMHFLLITIETLRKKNSKL